MSITFSEWRQKINGENDSAFEKIDDAVGELSSSIDAVKNAEKTESAGKVWMTTDNGAGWSDLAGGTLDPEQINDAVNSYLDKNPIQNYDDTEIRSEVSQLKDDNPN